MKFKTKNLVWLTVYVVSFFLMGSQVKAESASLEYKLKAVFLLNFAKFVSWPVNAFQSRTAPITICIIGQDPFGSIIDQVIKGEVVQGHNMAVSRVASEADLSDCHIAFFSAVAEQQHAKWIPSLKGTKTLKVGDTENFTQIGGMINFLFVDNKVKFEINTTAVELGNFEVSSKLLALGRSSKSN